jgi:hypothetical protein
MSSFLSLRGFTVEPGAPADADAIQKVIAAIPGKDLLSHLEEFDPDGLLFWDDIRANNVREALYQGVAAFVDAFEGPHSGQFPLPDGATFVVVGGTSAGDNPFEDGEYLELLLSAAEIYPAIAQVTGFRGWGVVVS